MRLSAVILAAGQGTRMRSAQPKVLHPLMGKPLVHYPIETATRLCGNKPLLVIGHGAGAIRKAVGEAAVYVEQNPQLGTGHAVQQAEPVLRDQADLVLVILADMPLLQEETLQRVVDAQQANPGPVTMLTISVEDARGFGRVVRDAQGDVRAIVEEAQATPEQLAIRELNASVYCFDAQWLWQVLPRIPLSPKGEYYLTDTAGLAVSQGLQVKTVHLEDASEAIGINTRVHLAEAETLLRKRINQHWMLQGVTLIDPSSTYIEPSVMLSPDTVIWPNTYLRGKTSIGAFCQIGPNTVVQDSQLGDNCKAQLSVIEGAVLEDHVDIGPFGHLRKGAHLASGVHMGNFGEVKNSYLGPGAKMGHFSYLGDATIGEDVNIGAGTITCNYDGVHKNPTVVEKGAFIGSDTMLVAPVKIGAGARTGAGAVVTKDVPDGTLVVGVPARPIRKIEENG